MKLLVAENFEEMNPSFRFATVVGSHMWGMDTPTSDVDYFAVYTTDTKNLLRGTATTRSECIQLKEANIDFAFHETGHLINQLVSGNVNFLWGIFSPVYIVCKEKKFNFWGLRELAEKSLSKSCAKSIYGMSKHNYEKYIRDKKLTEKELEKKCNTVVRTLKFGQRILDGKGITFVPSFGNTLASVKEEMEIFKEKETKSLLPETCRNEDNLRFWLLEERMSQAGWSLV